MVTLTPATAGAELCFSIAQKQENHELIDRSLGFIPLTCVKEVSLPSSGFNHTCNCDRACRVKSCWIERDAPSRLNSFIHCVEFLTRSLVADFGSRCLLPGSWATYSPVGSCQACLAFSCYAAWDYQRRRLRQGDASHISSALVMTIVQLGTFGG